MQITPELISRINHLLSFGLVKGAGKPIEGQMCVEQLITVAVGEKFSDDPTCVGSEVAKAKRSLNDCNWSSNQARAEGMKYLAVAQLGSNTLNQNEFRKRLFFKSCQKILPETIHRDINIEKAESLEYWKRKFSNVKTREEFKSLWKIFYNYYNYYYHYYHYYYYYNYYYYYYDSFILLIADTILDVLKEMKSPGCEWLHLVK